MDKIMDKIKFIKYKNRLKYYFEDFHKKNINILQLGCYNKEVTQIFIDLLTHKKSKLVCIDTFKRDLKFIHTYDYHTFQKHFLQIINNSNKIDQIDIMKIKIDDGLIELKSNKSLFDIIFIDMSYEHYSILYKIILSWELLKNNGIIIFDNYECSLLEDKEKCPLYALESFKTIYNDNILNITLDIDLDDLKYSNINNYNNIFEKIEQQFVFKKIESKIKKKEQKINELCDSLLNYDLTYNYYNLPKLDILDIQDINWNTEYYEENEGEIEIEKNIIKINKNLNLNILNKLYNIYFNRKDIKNINYSILDLNYLIQTKKYNYNIFIKYIDKYSKHNNNIVKIIDILNIYINTTSKNIILMNDYMLNNLKKKKYKYIKYW